MTQPVSLVDPATPLIPVRMLNEYVYCPRLGYLMWVQGEFEHNAYTVEDVIRHRRVDKPKGKLPEQPEEEPAAILRTSRVAPLLGLGRHSGLSWSSNSRRAWSTRTVREPSFVSFRASSTRRWSISMRTHLKVVRPWQD